VLRFNVTSLAEKLTALAQAPSGANLEQVRPTVLAVKANLIDDRVRAHI